MSPAKKPAEQITIPEIRKDLLRIRLVGDSPLICNRFSERAIDAMLGKQMKKAKGAREAKDPERDFRDSLYPMAGGYGIPAVAFKAACVEACRFIEDIKMTELRGALHVVGEMVRIEGKPTMRRDIVRNFGGKPDVRFRGEFKKWSAEVIVQYNGRFLSAAQIVNIFNNAGFGVGVGDYRPGKSNSGTYGRFHVEKKGGRS